jgi:hypothetical protein
MLYRLGDPAIVNDSHHLLLGRSFSLFGRGRRNLADLPGRAWLPVLEEAEGGREEGKAKGKVQKAKCKRQKAKFPA